MTKLILLSAIVFSSVCYGQKDSTKNYLIDTAGFRYLLLPESGFSFGTLKKITYSILVVSANGEKVMEIDSVGRVFIKDTLQAMKEIFRYAKGEQDSIFQWLNKLSKAEEVLKYISKGGFLIDRKKYLEALKEYYK